MTEEKKTTNKTISVLKTTMHLMVLHLPGLGSVYGPAELIHLLLNDKMLVLCWGSKRELLKCNLCNPVDDSLLLAGYKLISV